MPLVNHKSWNFTNEKRRQNLKKIYWIVLPWTKLLLKFFVVYKFFLNIYSNVIISYTVYWNTFSYNYKLSFGRPQVNMYDECEVLKIKLKNKFLNGIKKSAIESEKWIHKRKSRKFYLVMNEMQKNKMIHYYY